MNEVRSRIKPGRASLIGGVAVAVASFIIWAAVSRELGFETPAVLGVGLLAAVGIGIWIRLADL